MKGWCFDTFLPFFPNVFFFLETWKPVLHRLYRGGHQACAFLGWFGITLKRCWVKPKPNVHMESPNQCQCGCGLFHPCNSEGRTYTLGKGQPEIKGLLWVAVTEGTAACCPLVWGAAGRATRLCSFTGCLGWEAEVGWDASGLEVFDVSRLRLRQNAAAVWPWQMEAAADLKGSGKLQTDRVCGSFGSLAAPCLRGGRSFDIQGEVSRGCDVEGNLGEGRHDFCNAAGDFCSPFFTSSASVESAMTVHLLCSADVEVSFSPSFILLKESLLKRHCIGPRSQGASPTHPDYSLVPCQVEPRKKPRLARSQGWSLVCSGNHGSLSGGGACQGSREVFQSWLSCSHWNKGTQGPAGWGQHKVRLMKLYWLLQGQIFSIKCWESLVFIIRHHWFSCCKRLHISILREAGQNHVPRAFYST